MAMTPMVITLLDPFAFVSRPETKEMPNSDQISVGFVSPNSSMKAVRTLNCMKRWTSLIPRYSFTPTSRNCFRSPQAHDRELAKWPPLQVDIGSIGPLQNNLPVFGPGGSVVERGLLLSD